MSSATAAAVRARSGKYLVFLLAEEAYGIDIFNVREIIGMPAITPVPQTPVFIKGVINLRGKIIPVVDLRTKFSMTQKEFTRDTCVVIVDVAASAGRLWMGIIVDSVRDVALFGTSDIEEVPSFGVRVDTSFLLGLGRQKENMTLLLDIEKVLSHEELIAVNTTAGTPETEN